MAETQFSHNNLGYVLSGDESNLQSKSEGEFWQYDADADLWTHLPSHPDHSRWAPASFINNNEAYLINGSLFGQYQSKVYKYNLNEEPPVSVSDWIQEVGIVPIPFETEINLMFEPSGSLTIRITNAVGKTVYNAKYTEKNIICLICILACILLNYKQTLSTY